MILQRLSWFSQAVVVPLEHCSVGSFLRTRRCWLGNEWKAFHGHWQSRERLDLRYTGKNDFPVPAGGVWVQLARHAGSLEGRQESLLAAWTGFRCAQCPARRRDWRCWGLPSWQGQGRAKELALPSPGLEGQDRSWLVPPQLSSTAGVCMAGWEWHTWHTEWSPKWAGWVQNSPLSLTEEGETSGAPYLYGLNRERASPRPWAFWQLNFYLVVFLSENLQFFRSIGRIRTLLLFLQTEFRYVCATKVVGKPWIDPASRDRGLFSFFFF